MIYKEIRAGITNGDLFLVEGRGIISRIIRAVTGQNISHVAILIWIDSGLMVAEMKEGIGFRMMAASQWLAESEGYIYYGKAPKQVGSRPEVARINATRLRGNKYSYISLFSVWLAQFTRKRNGTERLVCSTAVQKVWESCGYQFDQTPDPGDFLRLCDYTGKIKNG